MIPTLLSELIPIERGRRDPEDDLAWLQFLDLDAQQDEVCQGLRADDAPTRPSRTGYASLVEAIHAPYP